jgi:hypothetical protein
MRIFTCAVAAAERLGLRSTAAVYGADASGRSRTRQRCQFDRSAPGRKPLSPPGRPRHFRSWQPITCFISPSRRQHFRMLAQRSPQAIRSSGRAGEQESAPRSQGTAINSATTGHVANGSSSWRPEEETPFRDGWSSRASSQADLAASSHQHRPRACWAICRQL